MIVETVIVNKRKRKRKGIATESQRAERAPERAERAGRATISGLGGTLLGMICPQCKAEYRQGFTVCADCDVPLVESAELARRSVVEDAPDDGADRESIAGTPGDPNTDPFCSFWKGTDLRVCTEICTVLDEAAIPHRMIRRQDHLFNWTHQAPYQIGVPASLYEKAELAIKEAFGTDEESGENPLLLSEENSASIQKLLDMPLGEKLRPRPEEEVPSFLDHLTWRSRESDGEEKLQEEGERVSTPDSRVWYPEDATVEVWEGEPAEAREMIEMSLQENNIRMRWELEDGKAKLFVLPEHEERAKEIVREILEEKPLE
jgi:hypothetical protein